MKTETKSNLSFVIEGYYYKGRGSKKATKCFPSLNNLLAQAEKSPYAYNSDKKKYMNIASISIRKGLRGWKASGRIQLNYRFYEPMDGHYRDYDNISASAHKIINDALVKCKVIQDDSPKHLAPSIDEFFYTKGTPKIEVFIKELEK